MATKQPKMPTMIYVKWDDAEGEPYLVAQAEAESLLECEPTDIGIYSLLEVKRGRLAPKWGSE